MVLLFSNIDSLVFLSYTNLLEFYRFSKKNIDCIRKIKIKVVWYYLLALLQRHCFRFFFKYLSNPVQISINFFSFITLLCCSMSEHEIYAKKSKICERIMWFSQYKNIKILQNVLLLKILHDVRCCHTKCLCKKINAKKRCHFATALILILWICSKSANLK